MTRQTPERLDGERSGALPLSAYIRDPFVREAFRRAEREQGEPPAHAIAVARPKPPRLAGGAVVQLETLELADA